MKLLKRLVISVTFLALLTSVAHAACNFTVSPINFGIYNPISTSDSNTTTQFNVRCDTTTAYSLKILPENGQVVERTLPNMSKPGDTLKYSLYINAGYSLIFGDGTATSQFYSGSDLTVPVYARIPARQRVSAGSYSNTLNIDLSF